MKIKLSDLADHLIEEYSDAVAALGDKEGGLSEQEREAAYHKADKELREFVAALEEASHYPRIP